MKTLSKFDIAPLNDDFMLRLEDGAGETTALVLTLRQLDDLADAIDDLLGEDDEDDDGQTYQKPLG